MVNRIRRLGTTLLLGAGAALTLFVSPSMAAEKVVFKFGPFARSVSVDSLKSFASTGKASGELGSILRVVGSEQRQSLAGLLNAQLPFNVVQVDRVVRSSFGDRFLNEVAATTILPGGSEAKALRSAVILAAAQDQSINFGTVLDKYPTPTLTLDVPVLLKFLQSNPTVSSFLSR